MLPSILSLGLAAAAAHTLAAAAVGSPQHTVAVVDIPADSRADRHPGEDMRLGDNLPAEDILEEGSPTSSTGLRE